MSFLTLCTGIVPACSHVYMLYVCIFADVSYVCACVLMQKNACSELLRVVCGCVVSVGHRSALQAEVRLLAVTVGGGGGWPGTHPIERGG